MSNINDFGQEHVILHEYRRRGIYGRIEITRFLFNEIANILKSEREDSQSHEFGLNTNESTRCFSNRINFENNDASRGCCCNLSIIYRKK